MARGGSSRSGNNRRYTHAHRNNRGYTHAHSTSRPHSTPTPAPTPTPQNKLYKTANDLSNIMMPSAIILYLMAASRRKKKLEEESQTKHRTSADNSAELPENELPEKLHEDDKCKIQYSNMLDCLKNNPESQCKQFIKSMEECVNEV